MQLAIPPFTPRLSVPVDVQRTLDAAVAQGRHDAIHWSHRNPGGTPAAFDTDLVASVTAPPTGAALEADLAHSLAAMKTRTADGNEYAQHLAKLSGRDTWGAAVEEIGRRHGPEQARRATQLLGAIDKRNAVVIDSAKRQWSRLRPYQADPRVTTVVSRPEGNASYPSGHAAFAYLSATVLGAFLPERASDLRAMADQVAWSRVYGGVHYVSDVLLGARLGTRMATDALRRGGMLAEQAAA